MAEGDTYTGAGARTESLRAHRRHFHDRFGGAPGVRVFFSPGRVNLMGAHLDYNGGPVMPMAIDRGTFVAARPRSDREIHLVSTLETGELHAGLDTLPDRPSATWYDYPIGVLKWPGRAGKATCGLDVLFGGDLPIGAGLSSSASICVATAFALDRLWGLEGGLQDAVQAALWGEREFVGVRCGIMDPYAVGYARPGHLLWLDCKDATTRLLPLDTERLSIAVADTGVRRELALGAFNQRVEECSRAFEVLRRHQPAAECLRDVLPATVEAQVEELGPVLARRAKHVTEEVARTFAARDALLGGDTLAFGALISEAHTSLRDLYEVSIPELDCLVDAALEHEGVLGTRLTGAGFGGCTVILMRREAREGLAEHLATAFRSRFGRAPRVAHFGGDAGPRECLA